jgi:pimeloyl-ACP methyl ester carboxylesterase
VLAVLAVLAACGGGGGGGAEPPRPPERSDVVADRCLVRLHGRGDQGADPVDRGTYAEVAPTGNGTAGDGYEWRYDSTEAFTTARELVVGWIEAVGCERVVVDGFSNGGGFAGALYCRGESFDGRLVGVVLDDPVPDDAVAACRPPEADVALYWTGALAEAEPGVACADIGFTCGGDVLLGIDAYAEALGTTAQASPYDEHRWYRDAPELAEMLGVDGL